MNISNANYDVIDYLKGYSIFTIMLYHYLGSMHLNLPFSQIIIVGGAGVHLFVLLSGLGLSLSHKKKPISYMDFLKKRFIKVYIPYIIIVTISALFSIFIPIYQNSLYAYFGHLFLYKMFDQNIVASYGYHLWFVSMIFQFYAIYYLLVFIKNKLKNNRFILLCIILNLFWTLFVIKTGHESERVWNSFFLQYLWEFAIGMIIVDNIEILKQKIMEIQKSKKQVLLILLAFVGVCCTITYGLLAFKGGAIGKITNDIPSLIGYSAISITIYLLNIKILNNFFIFTGKISFTIYLLHIFVFSLINLFHLPNIFLMIPTFIVCYIVAFYYQKWINRIII